MTGANFINGAHLLLFTTDPKADQEALRRILGTQVVPAGEDRVIIALPAGEIATHATSGHFAHRHADHDLQRTVLYLMCDDLEGTIEMLASIGVTCTEVTRRDSDSRPRFVCPAEQRSASTSHPTTGLHPTKSSSGHSNE